VRRVQGGADGRWRPERSGCHRRRHEGEAVSAWIRGLGTENFRRIFWISVHTLRIYRGVILDVAIIAACASALTLLFMGEKP